MSKSMYITMGVPCVSELAQAAVDCYRWPHQDRIVSVLTGWGHSSLPEDEHKAEPCVCVVLSVSNYENTDHIVNSYSRLAAQYGQKEIAVGLSDVEFVPVPKEL